jgi:hypothetical protein
MIIGERRSDTGAIDSATGSTSNVRQRGGGSGICQT